MAIESINPSFDSWFETNEYHRIECHVDGISFYNCEFNDRLYTDRFVLLSSRPKNFRIETISTSNYDWNSTKLYLELCRQYNKKELPNEEYSLTNFKDNMLHNISEKIFQIDNRQSNEQNKRKNNNWCLIYYNNKIENYPKNNKISIENFFISKIKYKNSTYLIGISNDKPKISDFQNTIDRVLSIFIINMSQKKWYIDISLLFKRG